MILSGDLGGRFSASKKMSPFENISVDFWRPFGGAYRGGRWGQKVG
jgi:hypothetical protein